MDEKFFVYEYKALLDSKRLPVLKESASYEVDKKAFNSSAKIIELMNEIFHMEDLSEEYVYMIAYNEQFHILGIFEISHGIVNASLLGPREIFLRLLLTGAARFVLIHNHPSGDPTPSQDDLRMAKDIKTAANLMKIPFEDNIIIGKRSYISFLEKGLM